MKKIFSFLNEKVKLDIIKYNKNFQKTLSVDIEYYKEISRKYIIYGINGDGKEYDKYDTLIFEGKYLNGKRNGKGKEFYSNGKIKFEGTYLNGKKWNGKGYDINNKYTFLIENGNGKIKEYYPSGKLKYEAYYINGEMNGKIKEYKEDYEYINCREVEEVFECELYYLEYEGKCLKGERNGEGKEYHKNGKLKFEGEFLNGKRNGKGKEYETYNEFEGEYLDGEKWNGIGKEFYSDRKIKFKGEYLKGKRWNGIGYNINNNIEYKLVNGEGLVKEYSLFGRLEFEGRYSNGVRNGYGKEYDFNGKLEFEGEFFN